MRRGHHVRDSLSYKGYVGSVHFNADDEVFYGKIVGVDDLVTFEGTTVADLGMSFREAVEDYVALCRSVGKPARKSYKGSFNVRIPASLHRRAAEQATVRGISLNRLVQDALRREVDVASHDAAAGPSQRGG